MLVITFVVPQIAQAFRCCDSGPSEEKGNKIISLQSLRKILLVGLFLFKRTGLPEILEGWKSLSRALSVSQVPIYFLSRYDTVFLGYKCLLP